MGEALAGSSRTTLGLLQRMGGEVGGPLERVLGEPLRAAKGEGSFNKAIQSTSRRATESKEGKKETLAG